RSQAAGGSASVSVPRLANTGQPAGWTKSAKVITSVPGHVHCFSLVAANTLRLIWGNPRKADDVDIPTGARKPGKLVGEAYSIGCPDLSPNGRELLFTASTAVGGAEIKRSTSPDGSVAESVTPGSDPIWSPSGEEFVYNIDGAHAAIF